MLEYVLGFMIDPQGYYLSFGKFSKDIIVDENYWMYIHISSFLMAIYQNHWHLTHPDLQLQHFDFQSLLEEDNIVQLDADILSVLRKLSSLGYLFLLNRSFDDFHLIIGSLPNQLTPMQQQTLMELKQDILFHPQIDSNLYYPNLEATTLTELYDSIDKHQRIIR